MAGPQLFTLPELEARQVRRGTPYLEFLRLSGLSMGLYVLPAGGVDEQTPHSSDEVYLVVRGRARLEVEGDEHEVGPGTVVSVERGWRHRFVDIAEELHVLVFFAPAEAPDRAADAPAVPG